MMMTFAMLTRLSPDASHAPGRLRLLERDVIRRIESECPSLRWIANYVVLGHHNYFDLFSVPDMESALKVSLIVAAFGPAQTEIWPLLSWEDVKHLLDGDHTRATDGGGRTDGARRIEARAPAVKLDKGGLADAAIAYLRREGAAFRLTNFPVAETQPVVPHALRPGAHEVTTRVILVDGQPALACLPQGAALNIASLGGALGAHVVEATTGELPGQFRRAPEPIPPLGHLLGVPLYVDEQLASSTVIAFEAFSSSVSVQLAYEEFARIEEPRTVPIASRGSVTPSAPISTHMRS